MISPFLKLLLVAAESLSYFSYIKPINALVDFVPKKVCIYVIFSYRTNDIAYVKIKIRANVIPYWASGVKKLKEELSGNL